MKILILDDMKFRHDIFDKMFEGHDVTHVFKFFDFAKELENNVFDLICLDHDLGDEVSNPDFWIDGWGKRREFNGADAAVKVCELNDAALPKQVIIHSINSVGAKTMLHILQRKGIPVEWQPFREIP
jgi:hypothetical protein